MNEKIKKLIDWCQTETDVCVEARKNSSYSSQEKIFQSGKKIILDTVKDKLCSIYDEVTNESDFAYCDDFLCSKCGIHLTDWVRMDAKEDDRYEYKFKFCPNCGAKIVNHD